MEGKIDAILHYIGDWIDDNYGSRVEDCIDDLISMIKKIGEVRTMEGKAVKEIQAAMKTWTDAGIELAYNSGYEQGKADTPFTDTEQAEELAYQRGLNDAWECARKIRNMDIVEKDAIFAELGKATWQVIDELSPSDAIAKIKEYEQKKPIIEVNEYNFKKVCEALDDICNHECCCYGHEEACDIAEDYLEQLSRQIMEGGSDDVQ